MTFSTPIMKLNILCCLFSGVIILNSCSSGIGNNENEKSISSGWKAVYKHDQQGNSLEGSINELIQGIRNGYDVRVGWGWEKEVEDSLLRLEHMAEPLFLSIIQEKNVSIVIDAHPLLKSYVDLGSQSFGDGGHIWQCVLTTQGTFNAQVHDRTTGELLKDWPQRHKMTWFLEYPANPEPNNPPLFQ